MDPDEKLRSAARALYDETNAHPGDSDATRALVLERSARQIRIRKATDIGLGSAVICAFAAAVFARPSLLPAGPAWLDNVLAPAAAALSLPRALPPTSAAIQSPTTVETITAAVDRALASNAAIHPGNRTRIVHATSTNLARGETLASPRRATFASMSPVLLASAAPLHTQGSLGWPPAARLESTDYSRMHAWALRHDTAASNARMYAPAAENRVAALAPLTRVVHSGELANPSVTLYSWE